MIEKTLRSMLSGSGAKAEWLEDAERSRIIIKPLLLFKFHPIEVIGIIDKHKRNLMNTGIAPLISAQRSV
jgi:hypothetical protein